METTLRNLFAQVLNLDPVTISINDDFFALGGNDVRAANLATAARKRDIPLYVTDIYKSPILSDLTEFLSQNNTTPPDPIKPFSLLEDRTITWTLAQAAVACNISVLDIEDMYPITQHQETLLLDDQKYQKPQTSQIVMRVPSDSSIDQLKKALKEIARKEHMLRTRVVRTDEGIFQVVTKQGVTCQEKKVLKEYLAEDKKSEFMFGDPLLRIAVADDKYFVCTAHRLLCDDRGLEMLVKKVTLAWNDSTMTSLVPMRELERRLYSIARSDRGDT